MSQLILREKDLATLRETLRRFGFVRDVRVFGSRATGTARRASDLDLATPFVRQLTFRSPTGKL